jgi:hypothetical protein
MHVQIALRQKDVGVYLVVGTPHTGKEDREYFCKKMNDAEYQKKFFTRVVALGKGYWIEVGCDRKPVETFSKEETLWEFTKGDQWMHYSFILGKDFSPEANELSNENIIHTLTKEVEKLALVYQQIKAVD